MSCAGIHTRWRRTEPVQYACHECGLRYVTHNGPTPRYCAACVVKLQRCGQCGDTLANEDD